MPFLPVCKFFQNNTCRYGSKCKFRHVYEQQYSDHSAYSYDVRNKPSGVSILQKGRSSQDVLHSTAINVSTLINEIADHFKAVENSKMWPLSCFSCVPAYGNVPGFEDISPEELRLKAYIALQISRNFQDYISEVQTKVANVKLLKEIFINRGKEADLITREYITQASKKVESVSNFSTPFSERFVDSSSNFALNQNCEASYMEYQLPLTTSIFGQVPLKEEHPQQPSFGTTQNPFGQTNQKNDFGQISNIGFQEPSVFRESKNPQSKLFKANLFGQVFNSNILLTGSTSEQHQSTVKASGLYAFDNSSQSIAPILLEAKAGIYSNFDSLTIEELDQFKAETFTYGKVPIKPPPIELCH